MTWTKDARITWNRTWLVLGLMLIAFALRVYRLGAQSLWWDELFGIAVSRFPFPEWLAIVLDNRGNPPGIYFLETLWNNIGTDAFSVRFLSVCFGVLAVALIYRVGKLFGGAPVGLIAAALLTISPHHLWYSQEARMYAPQIFCALASSYFFVQMLRQPSWGVTIGYALASVAILYLHYHPFFILAQLTFLVWFRRRYLIMLPYWFVAVALAGLLYAPWFLAVFTTGGLERAPMGWVPPTQWYDPILTLYVFWLGATNDPSNWLNWIGFGAVVLIAGVTVWSVWRTRLEFTRAWAEKVYLLIWLALPILMIWAISLDLPISQKRSAYVDRYLSPEFPAWLILIALGVTYLLKSHPRVLALGLVIACVPLVVSAAQMYLDPYYARDNWQAAADLVRNEASVARDLLIVRADQQLPLAYYGTNDLPWQVISFDENKSNAMPLESILSTHRQAQRLWLFSGTIPNNVHRFVNSSEQQRVKAKQDPVKQILDGYLKIDQEILYQGILVTIYSRY